MIFAPVRLGETSLNAEAVAADKKSCKRFGPCGVGKEALFLNSYFIDRRYYVAFSSVRRVFKRVAMSQGGFSLCSFPGEISISRQRPSGIGRPILRRRRRFRLTGRWN